VNQQLYERAKRFILQRARPIDHAKWRFHFEGASPEVVLDVLSQYQNGDGGFGYGLEPDFWNPASSPIQTWAATEAIRSLGYENGKHPVVVGILKFLESRVHFHGHTWDRTIASNNDHPRAPWWTHRSGDHDPREGGYNPTASLAGFALQFSPAGSKLYELAVQIAAEALRALLDAASVEVHELSCFLTLLDSLLKTGTDVKVDLASVEKKIGSLVNASLTRDTGRWKTEYVCRPSRFIRTRTDRFFPGNQEITEFECQFLRETQRDDGSWPVTWNWAEFPQEWPVAREWWKSAIVVENLVFLRNMEKGTGN